LMRAGEHRGPSAAKGKFCAAKRESLSLRRTVHQDGFFVNRFEQDSNPGGLDANWRASRAVRKNITITNNSFQI
jgi:hypothetical protein